MENSSAQSRKPAVFDTIFDKSAQSPDGTLNRPNIVMIVLDDLGFGDFGCHGSGIATPNIDALADHGLRYNSFHVTAVCSATRACLLTGRNHHAVGMGALAHLSFRFPGYTARIPKSAGTVARLLCDAGYNTFAVGKWHLTPTAEIGPAGPFDRWPLGLGFERHYGFLDGMTDQWMPDLVRDNGFIEPPASPDEGYHLTEDLASQAIRLVQDQQQAMPGKPFFLYLATGAPHWPHQVPASWAQPYRNQFDAGWETYRHDIFERQLKLGVIPPTTMLTERPSWVAQWEGLPAGERRLYARMMEVYAGFLTHADAQIGRVLDFLRTLGVLDDTLVMVVSDNGASADGGPHGMLSSPDDEIATMLSRIDELGGTRSAYNHYAWGWAWAGNTPFKLWKEYTWLGGVRVPLIVHWPTAIANENHGQVRDQFCHAIDLMPTILDAAGVELPESVDGVAQQRVDGRSLRATFNAPKAPSPRSTQYFEMLGSRAIYHDGWKATTNHVIGSAVDRQLIEGSHSFDTDSWSLYSLIDDFSEANDLASARPDQLRTMIEQWWFEAGRNQVLLMEDPYRRADAMEPVPGMEPPVSAPRREALPGGGRVDTPSFLAGFRLTAEVELASDRAAGIVAAQRNRVLGGPRLPRSGWACYFVEGRMTVAFNLDGSAHTSTTDEPIAAGRHDIEITYTPCRGTSQGTVAIILDGREVSAQPLPSEAQAPPSWQHVPATLLVGRDHGFPLCEDYQPPFPFTDHIHRITFELPKSESPPQLHEQITTALKHD
ncbi:arylsulfatase [Amycolatopsis alkalitolerans]|uniref:Arylsulfatase n=1 Tax=Amycolatopsis alkalitolerans TaxID=2547244 RepID=A0A5C4LTU8_9PSEU|nr:arylsulfatase [Amycolatopsis alkalitolerans]TNC22235.1 arylsulfatase [Amycolatopsis alkalitolerans]